MHAAERIPAAERRAPAFRTPAPQGIPVVLALQRSVGNRAVRAILAREDGVRETERLERPARDWGYGEPEERRPADPTVAAEWLDRNRRQLVQEFEEWWSMEVNEYSDPWFDLGEYKQDFLRIIKLLVDKDRAEQRLLPLEGRLRLEESRNPRGALERALKHFEKLFGFSTRQMIPLDILPAEDFRQLLGAGLVPKDIGAGLRHGEMSHRLQWIAIMNEFAAHPGRWNHTPLQLLAAMDFKPFQWIQGRLMDKPRTNLAVAYTRPDNIVRLMRDDADTRHRLPRLAAEITRRWEKRQALAYAWAETDDIAAANRAYTRMYAEGKRGAKWRPTPSGQLLVDTSAPAEAPLEKRLRQQRELWGK